MTRRFPVTKLSYSIPEKSVQVGHVAEDPRPQTIDEVLKVLKEFNLEPMSFGVWFFSPGGGRFRDPYVDSMTAEQISETAAGLAEHRLKGLETRRPKDVYEDSLSPYQRLEKDTGMEWATEQRCYITEEVDKDILVNNACGPALGGSIAPRAIWIRKSESKSYKRDFKMLVLKDSDRVPLYHGYINVCDKIIPKVLEVMGLKPDMSVKGSDSLCAAVGKGMVAMGRDSPSLGTSGTMLRSTDTAEVNPLLHSCRSWGTKRCPNAGR